MINLLIDTNSRISGNLYRYNDFINYMYDNSISYIVNDNISEKYFNLIDLSYYVHNTDIDIDYNCKCKFFCGNSARLVSILSDYNYPHRDYILNNLITHNLYYSKKLNCSFIPMYMYNNININRNIKYKYGIFISSETDANYNSVFNILNELNINTNDILFMDREDYLNSKNNYNTTKDNNYFMSSIDTFLDIANDYTCRHVFSRTYLEVINNNIDFNVISFNNSKPITLLGFKHINYNIIDSFKDFNYYNISYDNKYFKTQNYSNYIKEVIINNNFNILYDYIEDYHNDRFIIN